jgi:hypothetical protein
MFNRLHDAGGGYYYHALQVTTFISGTFIFTSASLIDMYGSLYQGSFDPAYPSQNRMTSDDDAGGKLQFFLTAYLSSGSFYVLVITTYHEYRTGTFQITASGLSMISISGYVPSTSRPVETTSKRICRSLSCNSTKANEERLCFEESMKKI